MAHFQNTDTIWDIIRNNYLEVDNNCSCDVKCGICAQLMINPFKTLCGCQFCEKCISKFLTTTGKFCPGQNQLCNKEEFSMGNTILRDETIDSKIAKVVVKCPNEFCEVKLPLDLVKEHLRLCDKKAHSCPYQSIGCEDRQSASEVLVGHMNSDTMRHSQLLIEAIDNLRNELNNLTAKVALMKKESEMKDESILNLSQEIENKQLMIDRQNKEIEKLHNDDNDIKIKVEGLKRDLENMQNKLNNEKPKTELDANEIVKMNEENRKKLDSLTLEVRDLHFYEEKDFMWRINNFASKKRDRRYMTSDTFYRDSYNLCMDVWFNGEHLGIDCCIMKGQYDAWGTIVWPMCRTVTLSIVNHITMLPYKSERFHYSTYLDKLAFNRPISEWNNGIGNPAFIRVDEIMSKPEILSNDSIIVSCIIDIF